MNKIYFGIILLVVFSGCATVNEVTLPSGEKGISIRCEEFISRCYEKAGELCPNGYEIKDKTSSSNILVPVYDLMITCK